MGISDIVYCFFKDSEPWRLLTAKVQSSEGAEPAELQHYHNWTGWVWFQQKRLHKVRENNIQKCFAATTEKICICIYSMRMFNWWFKGFMAMRPIFRGFWINRFGIGPLHYISSRSDFGFKFTEIFIIEKWLSDLESQKVADSASRGVADSPTRRVQE